MTTPLPVNLTPNKADGLMLSWPWLRDRNPRAAVAWLAGIRDAMKLTTKARKFDSQS